MKTVWMLNHYAQEPSHPGGTRHYSLGRHLLSSGWRTFIIAASTGLHTSQQRLAPGETTRIDTFDGVSFLRVRTPEYKGNGGGRLINMLVYCWRALLPSTTHGLPRPDVVIGSSVHPFAAVAGRLLARRFRVPFIFEVRDLWPQTLVDMGRLSPNSFSVRLMRWMERWLYRRADRIVVLLPLAADYIVPLGIPMERIVYVPNGVEPGSPPPDATPRETFDLMYFGAHGQANGLDNIVRAMKFVSDKDGSRHIRLRMIGDGPMKASLVATARELGLQNVVFEPPVPKSAIPDIAATADAFIFNLMDVPVFRYGISSNKLFDFLAASRPIIFCCTSGNNPVADASAGITVAPNDPEALSRAIMTMAATPIEERSRMGRSGRSYVEANHSFGSLARRLSAVLDEAIRSSR